MRVIGCAEFVREFLLGQGPLGSPSIDPKVGTPQADIFFYYKRALMRAKALDQATREEEKQARREKRVISPENIEKLTERYLSRMPYKSRGCRFHSFRITSRPVHRAAISVLQRPVEMRTRLLGKTPIALFTVSIQ